jgi:hypothetical protein
MTSAANAGLRSYGSQAVRNTYQIFVTGRDLYHQHHFQTRRAAGEAARSRWPAWNLKIVGMAVHRMAGFQYTLRLSYTKKANFLDMMRLCICGTFNRPLKIADIHRLSE